MITTGSDDARYALCLANGFIGLVAVSFGLIVLGALVRAHEAGLACPDWPLCFGAVIPELNLKVAFEWTHRVVAGSVSLLFVALGWLVLRRRLTRDVSARLLAVAALLLGIQILLGALTVWKLLASWTVTSHLVTGNAFAVSLLWISCVLREASRPARERRTVSRSARSWVTLIALALVFQVVLGGLVSSRFAGLACPEWPTCNGGQWLPSSKGSVGLHLLHRWNGTALIALLAAAWAVCRSAPALARITAIAFALGAGQVVVGILNVVLGIPVEVTGLHSALATALVLTVSLALREVWRPARSAPA